MPRPVRRLVAACLALAACAAARAEVTPGQMQAMVEAHGTAPILAVLVEAGAGRVTVLQRGQLRDAWGRPRADLVTPETMARDMNLAGLGIADLEARIGERAAAEAARAARQTGETEVARGDIPLANLDPALRVRARSKSWTVRSLMEDAEKERRGWPRELNELRKEEAFRRNRSIERTLLEWESRYGSTSYDDVQNVLLRQGRDRLYRCRSLHRKRNREEWADLDCDTASRWNPSSVGRSLKAEIQASFDAFEAAVMPSVKRLQVERSVRRLY